MGFPQLAFQSQRCMQLASGQHQQLSHAPYELGRGSRGLGTWVHGFQLTSCGLGPQYPQQKSYPVYLLISDVQLKDNIHYIKHCHSLGINAKINSELEIARRCTSHLDHMHGSLQRLIVRLVLKYYATSVPRENAKIEMANTRAMDVRHHKAVRRCLFWSSAPRHLCGQRHKSCGKKP